MVILNEVVVPTIGIRHQQENTVAYVGETELGNGCLYITESCVAWLNNSSRGFTLNYPSISLHAISRDTTAFFKPCFYIMFDGKLEDSNEENEDDSGSEGDQPEIDPVSDITEIRFVPQDISSLDAMYSTLCDCQVLHPDPDDSFSDYDDYEAPNPGQEEANGDGDDNNEDDDDEGSDSDERRVGASNNNNRNDGTAMETDTVENGQFDDVDE